MAITQTQVNRLDRRSGADADADANACPANCQSILQSGQSIETPNLPRLSCGTYRLDQRRNRRTDNRLPKDGCRGKRANHAPKKSAILRDYKPHKPKNDLGKENRKPTQNW